MICFAYVFPCVWEDHCKVGFSRDPLARLQALHRRWFDFFDLDRALLVETETERDARDLELELRRPLAAHKAPMPMTVYKRAGGHTEWLRGAYASLREHARLLENRGHTVHAPLRQWLSRALCARSDRLYAWTLAQLPSDPFDRMHGSGTEDIVRDALDTYAALGVDVEPLVPPGVYRWYRDRSLSLPASSCLAMTKTGL
jgi:Meiotically Up-regulated Gene 113 (MUG113) protein